MHGSSCEQEAAENLLAVLAVTASRKAARITAQVFEPAFAQISRGRGYRQCAGKAKNASTSSNSNWNFSTISGADQRQRAQNRRAQYRAWAWFSASQIHLNSRRNLRR